MERYPTTRFVFDRKKMATSVRLPFGGRQDYSLRAVVHFNSL